MVDNNIKPINCGFVVICSNLKLYSIKNTVNSIKENYKKSKIVCIFPENFQDQIFLNKLETKIVFSKNTNIALLNSSLKNMPCNDWNFIISNGNYIRPCLDFKYTKFINNEKEIFFPLINKTNDLSSVLLKGFLLNKKTIDNIGYLEESENFEYSKCLWINKIIENKIKIKGIYGSNFF